MNEWTTSPVFHCGRLWSQVTTLVPCWKPFLSRLFIDLFSNFIFYYIFLSFNLFISFEEHLLEYKFKCQAGVNRHTKGAIDNLLNIPGCLFHQYILTYLKQVCIKLSQIFWFAYLFQVSEWEKSVNPNFRRGCQQWWLTYLSQGLIYKRSPGDNQMLETLQVALWSWTPLHTMIIIPFIFYSAIGTSWNKSAGFWLADVKQKLYTLTFFNT